MNQIQHEQYTGKGGIYQQLTLPISENILIDEHEPEVKHWHGAAPDCWFSHLAVEVPGEDSSNEWCEPVAEKTYETLR